MQRNESTLSHYITSSSDKQRQEASNVLKSSFKESNESENSKVVDDVSKVRSINFLQSNLVISCIISDSTFQHCMVNVYGRLHQCSYFYMFMSKEICILLIVVMVALIDAE